MLTELDRQSSLDDTRTFIRKWRIPGVLKAFLVGPYHRKIILQSLDVETVLAVLRRVPALQDLSHSRFPGAPAFVVEASKIGNEGS